MLLREQYLGLFILIFVVSMFQISNANEKNETRDGKVLSVFQVVKFPNDICKPSDTTKNGTCYTSSECSSKGGTSSGTCAEGFGVCCIFSISCGSSSSENCTYLEESSFTTLSTNPCTYTICKCDDNICRIRLDFLTLVLTAPNNEPAVDAAISPDTTPIAPALGTCSEDVLTLTSTGSGDRGNAICGTNTNQHVYMDADSSCNKINFAIGSSTSTSRSWNIKITQYTCGDTNGGPPGCLQYQTGTSGTVRSFNFPEATSSSTVSTSTQHLSNMAYDICFRREAGYCRICYSPTVTIPATGASFGLSASPSAAIPQSLVDSSCYADYLSIPVAVASTVTSSTATAAATAQNSLFCGRVFAIIDANANTVTICSLQNPFRMGFHSNQGEMCTTAITAMDNDCEYQGLPAGTWGFHLDWFQTTC